MRKYSNLLVERGEGAYGFIHLTFEEYLAAQGVAQRGELDLGRAVEVLLQHLDDPAWHETILLTVGYLGIVQRNRRSASAVIERLLAAKRVGRGQGWNVVVAGEALRDVGDVGITDRCRSRVLGALAGAMQNAAVRPDYRRRAGLLLGWLGWRPDDLDAWIEIPAGPFLYGDGRDDGVIEHAYRIGRYPVTNAQFARFVEAGGYEDKALLVGGGSGLAQRRVGRACAFTLAGLGQEADAAATKSAQVVGRPGAGQSTGAGGGRQLVRGRGLLSLADRGAARGRAPSARRSWCACRQRRNGSGRRGAPAGASTPGVRSSTSAAAT